MVLSLLFLFVGIGVVVVVVVVGIAVVVVVGVVFGLSSVLLFFIWMFCVWLRIGTPKAQTCYRFAQEKEHVRLFVCLLGAYGCCCSQGG